jgi:hypothetical protein
MGLDPVSYLKKNIFTTRGGAVGGGEFSTHKPLWLEKHGKYHSEPAILLAVYLFILSVMRGRSILFTA